MGTTARTNLTQRKRMAPAFYPPQKTTGSYLHMVRENMLEAKDIKVNNHRVVRWLSQRINSTGTLGRGSFDTAILLMARGPVSYPENAGTGSLENETNLKCGVARSLPYWKGKTVVFSTGSGSFLLETNRQIVGFPEHADPASWMPCSAPSCWGSPRMISCSCRPTTTMARLCLRPMTTPVETFSPTLCLSGVV